MGGRRRILTEALQVHSPGSPYSATGLAIWYLGRWYFSWGCGLFSHFDLSFLTILLPTLINYQDFRQKKTQLAFQILCARGHRSSYQASMHALTPQSVRPVYCVSNLLSYGYQGHGFPFKPLRSKAALHRHKSQRP